MTARRTKKILTIALLASLVIFIIGLWYANKSLQSKAQQVAVTKAQAEAPATQYQTLLQTKSQLGQLGDVAGLLHQALPAASNQSLIIAELNSLAKSNNISLNTLSFGNGTTAVKAATSGVPGVNVTQVTIDTGGMNYKQMIGFLKSIEDNRWIMQPTSITITPDTDDNTIIKTLNLSLNIYSSNSK